MSSYSETPSASEYDPFAEERKRVLKDDLVHIPREDMDSTWCVHCCHSHPSGEVCGAEYIYVEGIGHDFCGCDADHHPEPKP